MYWSLVFTVGSWGRTMYYFSIITTIFLWISAMQSPKSFSARFRFWSWKPNPQMFFPIKFSFGIISSDQRRVWGETSNCKSGRFWLPNFSCYYGMICSVNKCITKRKMSPNTTKRKKRVSMEWDLQVKILKILMESVEEIIVGGVHR